MSVMRMSVFKQGRKRYDLDATECISAAVSEADTDLVLLTMRTGHPVLVGLDADNAIIKPFDEGDDKLSFAGLIDQCHTLVHLEKMQEAGVRNPDDIPESTYDVLMEFAIPASFTVGIQIRSNNMGGIRKRAITLFENDAQFREAVIDALLEQIRKHGEPGYRVADASLSDEPLEDQDWKIIED
jgi:hypothetical protein